MSSRHRKRFLHPALRPFPGRMLPWELRPRRVGDLARALPGGVEDPGFEILLRRIDSSPVHSGNQVEVYFEGRQAFTAMRDAGAAAERELLVESYILKDDRTGQLFLREVSAAAGRGVTVRVLADALGSASTRAEYWRRMKGTGAQVRLFHPLIEKLWYAPFRDHRKILVVDRQVAFTGGMNIGEEYGSPRPEPGTTWRDTHMRVAGPAAWEMAVVFSEGWEHAGGEPFEIEPLPVAPEPVPGARVLVLDSRSGRGQVEVASALAAIVAASRRRLWITNAYFAPGRRAVRLLKDAARRGVDVRLLLPGLTDVPLVRHAGHGYYGGLLAHGVRIFEYQPAILHAKTLVADDYVSVVGSANLDFRSFVFNAECNLAVLDHATGAKMAAAFTADLEQAVEIRRPDWKRRALPHRWGDRAARWLSPLL